MDTTPIDSTILDDIKQALIAISKKDVVVSTETDQELIGGIRIEMDGKIFDGSIKGKLDAIRHMLSEQVGLIETL